MHFLFTCSQTKHAADKKKRERKTTYAQLVFSHHLWGWLKILDSNLEKDNLYPVWKGLNIMIQSSLNEAWMRFFLLFSPISSALLSSFGVFILARKIAREQQPRNHSQWQQRHSVPLGVSLQQHDHSQSSSMLYLNAGWINGGLGSGKKKNNQDSQDGINSKVTNILCFLIS